MNNPINENISAIVLADCLDAIQTRQMTVEECLLQHPMLKDELRDLLLTAQVIESSPVISPRTVFRRTAREDLINRLEKRRSTPFWEYFRRVLKGNSLQKQPGLSLSWVTSFVLVVLFILGGVGVMYASASALPGDTLYNVKIVIEKVRLVAADDDGDVRLYAEFSQMRLIEMGGLVSRGDFIEIPEAVSGYQTDIAGLLKKTTELRRGEKPDAEVYLNMFHEIYHHHMQVLSDILNNVPDQVKPSIQQAIQTTENINTEKPKNADQPVEPLIPEQPGNEETPESADLPGYEDTLAGETLEAEYPKQNSEFNQGESLDSDAIPAGTNQPVPTNLPSNSDQSNGGGQPDGGQPGGGQPEMPGGAPDKPSHNH